MSSLLETVLLQQQAVKLLLGVLVILSAAIFVAAAAAEPNSSCVTTCGSLHDIPYPFGTSKGCYLDSSFLITCKSSSKKSTQTPFLGVSNIKVLNISLDGELRVSTSVARVCPQKLDNYTSYKYTGYNYTDTWLEFPMSDKNNVFIAVGCNTRAIITQESYEKLYSIGCRSRCENIDDVVNGSCSGVGCCQAPIRTGMTYFSMDVRLDNRPTVRKFNPCGFAFVVEKKEYDFSTLDLQNMQNKDAFPLVLDWAIGSQTCEVAKKDTTGYACKSANSQCYDSTNGPGYRCSCSSGYYGNPYHSGGCKDIDECEGQTHNCSRADACVNTNGNYTCLCPKGYVGDGRKDGEGCAADLVKIIPIAIGAGGGGFICMLVFTSWLYFGYNKRKIMKLREKFFKQNGGLILEQRLGRQEGSTETLKIFTVEQLQKATKNYDESRIIGRGGFGTVYKGFLPDNKIVAIKKSKIDEENQIEQFINEVVVLSQINHRHVVKLLGCCLETQVPLLVYEFVPKGTLFKYIHQESNASTFTWETRLRIAAETAEALWYLHSAASIPIIHRDVKSTNILLDDDFTAKVSDFGTSRLVPRDQTQLATVVQGTLGYLDPEYLQTNQLTEKSDVYSFGVVLVELLTGKEALSFARSEEQRSLAMYFISSMKEERLFEILENHIVAEGNKEQIQQFVELARSCLAVKGNERPTMREVAMELEGIRKMQKHPWVNLEANSEEVEHLLGETCEANKYGESSSTITTGYHHSMNIERGTSALGDGR